MILQYCYITLPFYAVVRISFYAHIALPFYAARRIVFYAHIPISFYAAKRILQLRNIQYNDTVTIQACCSVSKQYVDSVIHQALTRYPDRRTAEFKRLELCRIVARLTRLSNCVVANPGLTNGQMPCYRIEEFCLYVELSRDP